MQWWEVWGLGGFQDFGLAIGGKKKVLFINKGKTGGREMSQQIKLTLRHLKFVRPVKKSKCRSQAGKDTSLAFGRC
jgi:hypothetical protein